MNRNRLPAKTVYFWASGQDDNIGDVVLRRRLYEQVDDGREIRMHVGQASTSFVSGFGVSDRTVLYRNFLRFVLLCTRDSALGRAFLVFDPGEVNGTRRILLMHLLLLPAAILGKARGAGAIRIGVGIGRMGKFALLVMRLSACTARMNVWRDEKTRDLVGIGEVAPDLAFSYFSTNAFPRRFMAVSMRGDRNRVSDNFVSSIRALAVEYELDIYAVVQVRRDRGAMRQLAERLNCKFVDWPDRREHATHETVLREVYAMSRFIVSDRLHGLIMGVTEGATPLGLMEHADDKVARSFPQDIFGRVSCDVSGMHSDSILQVARTLMADSEKRAFPGPAITAARAIDRQLAKVASSE